MKRPRRTLGGVQAKVALVAIRGDKTLVELSEHFEVHPNQITQWKSQLLERAAAVFGGRRRRRIRRHHSALQAKVGQLAMECDF